MGCEVSRRGKAIRLKAPGWKNVARMDDKLGAGVQRNRNPCGAGWRKAAHAPQEIHRAGRSQPKVNLLVDIQAKLQPGKVLDMHAGPRF